MIASSHISPLRIVVIGPTRGPFGRLASQLGERLADAELQVLAFTDRDQVLPGFSDEVTTAFLVDETVVAAQLQRLLQFNIGPIILMLADGSESTYGMPQGVDEVIGIATALDQPALFERMLHWLIRSWTLDQSNVRLRSSLVSFDRHLEKKNDRIMRLTDTTHRFVENVAHEFRTPLTVISEFTSILGDGIGGPITERQGEFLQFIQEASRDLTLLISDFLERGKLRARTLRVDRRPHALKAIMQAALPLLTSRAAAAQVDLDVAIDEQHVVYADDEKIARIMTNLVTNAIKVSGPGSQVRIWSRNDERRRIEIGVTDSGPGLPPEELQIMQTRFRAAGDPPRSSLRGFGLGLNVAKELIWVCLGEPAVRSEEGCGSTFSFVLPPCRRDEVIHAYRSALAHLDEPRLALLRVGSDGAESQEICRFLAQVCHPMDIAFEAAGRGEVVLLGLTAEPDQWASRIHRLAAERDERGHATHLGPLRIASHGPWPIDQVPPGLLHDIDPLTTGTHHELLRSHR